MPSKQKKRRKNLATSLQPLTLPYTSNFSQSGPMSQPYATGAGPLGNGQGADAAYHPAFSSFTAPALTPTYPLPGLTSFAPPMNGQYQSGVQTPITPQFTSATGSHLISGNSDLEKLERLKREILDGQNPVYKAVPQPDFLASLYLGRSPQAQSTVPAHPEQIPPSQTPSQIPSQAPSQTPPSPDATSAQRPDGESKKTDLEQPALAREGNEGEAETVSAPANIDSTPCTPVEDSETTPPQSALNAKIMDEIARFRATSGSQLASSYGNAASTNSNGNVSSLKRHAQEDVKPVLHGTSGYQAAGHTGTNGSSIDSSRRPSSYVSDDQSSNNKRPGDHWNSRPYDSRYDHEGNVITETQDGPRTDQRYDDSQFERYDPRERLPSFSEARDHRPQEYGRSDDRVDDRSPIVPAHVSETVRSLTESLARGGIGSNTFSSIKPDAPPALAEVLEQCSPIGRPVSAVNKPPSLATDVDYQVRTGFEEVRSHAFVMNDRARRHPTFPSVDSSSVTSGLALGRATPLEERISGKVPLQARISSPETKARLQEHITKPQEHIGYGRPPPPMTARSVSHLPLDDSRPASTRLVRPVDEGKLVVSPVSTHSHQRAPNYDAYPHDAQERRSASVVPYRRDQEHDRRFPEVKKEPVVVYERPTYREREGISTEDRAHPMLESREWRERERAVYPPPPHKGAAPSTPNDERFPAHPPDAREWTPNDRIYKGSETAWDAQRTPPPRDMDRGRYLDRGEYERRPTAAVAPPPRSWDRNGAPPVTRPRPPLEVYPSPPVDRERYPPVPEYYDNPRVRARSPSPIRRDAPMDDMRPPMKRVRDEGSYYDNRRPTAYPGPGYNSQPPSPPPPPSSAAVYYEGGRASHPPPREAHPPAYNPRYRAGDADYYARRPSDMPPPRNAPPPPVNYSGRATYPRPDRDDRRYSMPPPRTA